jgi:hydrogenase nickel incorporation protein HypA/HybF
MHELSIAGAVLGSVLRHAGERRVSHVQLKVGHLRQVVPSALEFSWSLITRDTVAEDATLGIEAVPAAGLCRACGESGPQPSFPMHCAECGGYGIEIVAGEELQIDWIEVSGAESALSGRVS